MRRHLVRGITATRSRTSFPFINIWPGIEGRVMVVEAPESVLRSRCRIRSSFEKKHLCMEINYRSAEKRDCAKLAKLSRIASGGVVDYLFHALVPGMTPVEVLARRLETDRPSHSYRSAIVAVDGADVIGMALSYPSSYHKITDDMKTFLPAERLAHLRRFYAARIENSWYLDALAVDESHRRRGVGEKLILLTRDRAVENGCAVLSLSAFADNPSAISLYQRIGFERVRKVELERNDFIPHDGGCWLMRWAFAP
jgi:ribosomal protein S18 acetylase RimI-like enzyme